MIAVGVNSVMTQSAEAASGHRADAMDAVSTERLTKRYGGFVALSELTLRVPRGQIFGLLGPNGAGKTTLIRTLLGYVHRSSGVARVMGLDPAVDSVAVRAKTSYLPGDARLPRNMRGAAVLKFFADIQPEGDLRRGLQVAERLDLDLKRHVGFMSTGMRQKLAIAAVMGSRAPLLILDEPTANLDPTVRGQVLAMVTEAKHEGRTVVFSSHVLSEIEDVCDSAAFLKQGRLALVQSIPALRQRHRIVAFEASDRWSRVERPDPPVSLAGQITAIRVHNGQWVIDTQGDLAPLLPWFQTLDLKNLRIEAFGLRAVYDSIHCDTQLPIALSDAQANPSTNAARESAQTAEADDSTDDRVRFGNPQGAAS